VKKTVSIGALLNYLFIALVGAVTLYPFIYILSVSVSPPTVTVFRRVTLLPQGFSTAAYEVVFGDKRLILGFFNSVKYTLAGTCLSVFLTTLTAYPLAQPKFRKYARIYMRFVVFTMLFSGGLIPTYLTIRSLKMINTFWVMIIPGAVSSFYLILTRTFIQQLPTELFEAAVIEGSGDFDMYLRIVIPLSMPIIACISLYYAVGSWNSYMTPLIYLTSESKYPLQIFLRQIVMQSATQEMEMAASGRESLILGANYNSESIKAATLVFSTIPILAAYPFLQKYFVKGVMVGAIKG
jgi:ABC-type glycerol-3-phosphate transport system permease component